jgi:hypothetical protein
MATEPTTTTTALPCRDSYDARCGPFRWDPQPANQPLTAELSVLTSSPRVGEAVEFKIVATDDARISRQCYDGTFGEEGQTCHGDCFSQPAYGSWSPPPPEPDRWEGILTHVYQEPGIYTVSLTLRSGSDCRRPPSPYLSTGTATVTVTVGERPSSQ